MGIINIKSFGCIKVKYNNSKRRIDKKEQANI
jgi:hypothetical protein